MEDKLKPYFDNTLWLIAERVARIAVGVFLFAYMARYLGPVAFGTLNYAIVIAGLAVPFISLGLNRTLVMEMVRNPEQEMVLLGTVFVFKMAVAVAASLTLVTLVFALDFGPEESHLIIAIISIGNVFLAFDVIEYYFQSKVQSKYSAIYKSIAFFLSSLVKILLIIFEMELIYFALAAFLEMFFVAMFAFLTYQLRNGTTATTFPRWQLDISRGYELVRNSWPEVISGFGTILCMKLDQIMLEAFRGVEAVGVFSAAARLTDAWYFIPAAIATSSFPAIISMKTKDAKEYQQGLQDLFSIQIIVCVLIALVVTALSSTIIDVLFGVHYRQASTILTVYIWCLPAVALGVSSGSWIYAENRVILSAYRMIVGLLCNVLLNFILIRQYGGVGAAVATLVSLFIAFYVYDLFVSAMRPIFTMKTKALVFIGFPRYFSILVRRAKLLVPFG